MEISDISYVPDLFVQILPNEAAAAIAEAAYPDAGGQSFVPQGGGTDSIGVPWVVDEHGNPTIDTDSLPQNLVIREHPYEPQISLFSTDPDIIALVLAEYPDTYIGLFDDDGVLIGVYIGTYHVDGTNVVFVPNHRIPTGLLTMEPYADSPIAPPWVWPVAASSLLALAGLCWYKLNAASALTTGMFKQPKP